MEFDMESDPEVMYDLFGEDAACFAEYVFDRSHLHASHTTVLLVEAPSVFTSWKGEALLKSGRTLWETLTPK